MELTPRRSVVISLGCVVVLGAIVALASLRDAQFTASLLSGVAATASLIISVLALSSARSQAESSRQQAQFAREQAEYAGEQARLAAVATTFAYQPILLPVHDAVRVLPSAGADAHYPAIDRFQIPDPVASERVLLVDRSSGRAVLRLRNVGRGPALLVSGELVQAAGLGAALEGNPAIGPDQEERYSAMLPKEMNQLTRTQAAPRSDEFKSLWATLMSDRKCRERTFLLRVRYRSSAPNAATDELEAIFDPRGTGRWHTELMQGKAPID